MGPDALKLGRAGRPQDGRKNPRRLVDGRDLPRARRPPRRGVQRCSSPSIKPGNPEDLRETGRTALQIAATNSDPETLAQGVEVLDAARKLDPGSDELIVMTAMVRHLQARFEDELALYHELLNAGPRTTSA